ncbi:transcriptional regulator [Labrenzia sp. R4_2]|nr:transcriptional regulator [Labrenzia sp. R4_2]
MLDKAQAAWGPDMPEWIRELAGLASRSSLNAAAKRLGYSPATLSQTLANKYPGDLEKLAATVRGALMGETVVCPVLGTIGRDACLAWQSKPRAVTNAVRTRVFRACRSGCPNSRLKPAHPEARHAE